MERVLCKYIRVRVGWDGLKCILCAEQYDYIEIYRSRSESQTLKLKIMHSHHKILLKLTEIYWRWLSMTINYFMQSSVAKITHGSHVKSRTLKIKPRIHTIKFYRIWLKFIKDDSVWLGATLCKAAWLELHVDPTSNFGDQRHCWAHKLMESFFSRKNI